MSCVTHHSGCECYDREFAQTKASVTKLTEYNRVLREALEPYANRTAKLIVQEEQEPRVVVFVSGVPTISFCAGETWDCGSEAREALAKTAREGE